jgi:hypothetical protein
MAKRVKAGLPEDNNRINLDQNISAGRANAKTDKV